jgi:hypothetical protein
VRPVRARGTGGVVYVTAARAYLDAGADDGLAAGADLELRRGGEPAGRCKVETTGPHEATCSGGRPRAGDTFRFEAAPIPAPPKVLPVPPPVEVIAHRLAAVVAAPLTPVVFRGESGAPLVLPRQHAIDVSLSHQVWDVSPGGASSKESLDVLARGVPLASWLYLDLDARAEHWTTRQNARFRPQDKTRVYVWQAQLTAIPSEALTLSAGRILPWGVPGATVFDGAMAGWHGRWRGATVELGGFGGVVPTPDTLDPTSKRATGGAYWMLDRQVGGVTFRTEGRLAAVRSPELGTRGEATVATRFFLRALDASAEASLGMGGKVKAPGNLDAARLDLTLRPATGVSLGGSFRYTGLEWPQTFDPAAFPGRSSELSGFATVDLRPWLRVGGTGGWASDKDSKLSRSFFGPELSLPGVLWGWGSVAAGYLEERGWTNGRSAYGQVTARPLPPLRLLLRGSWAQDSGAALYGDEVSATVGATYELNRYLALRLTATGRTTIGSSGDGSARSLAGTATIQGGF